MAKRDSNFNPIGKSRGLRGNKVGVADWDTANMGLLVKAISTAANCGGALRFGYTADGGAYAVGIYGDGKPYNEYISPNDDVNITLALIIELFEAIADDQAIARNGAKTSK